LRPDSAAAAQIIRDSLLLNAAPRRITDILVEIIIDQNWHDDESVTFELAERWEITVLAQLRSDLTELNAHGWPAKFSFNSSSENLIHGACFSRRRTQRNFLKASAVGSIAMTTTRR
jgi:hypothetical protein